MNNSKENVTGTMFRRRVLCRTIAGNACDMLTITAPSPDTETLLKRVGVVITARVHPGETVASWMMQGVIDFLVSDCEEARKLREMYVFRIIPMMNPGK